MSDLHPSRDTVVVVNSVSLIPLTPETHSRDQSGKQGSAEPFSPQFFLGPENRLLGVLLAAISQDHSKYSPVVLHGPAGVGKSHFVGGLAARHRQAHPHHKTLVMSGVDFARAYASAVELDSVRELRAKYHQARFFALDGLESLGSKPSAQLELLHTLDVLQRGRRWVIVTARTPVANLSTLHASLRSRLSAGLDLPLAYLSASTRRAVVEDLARQNRLPPSHRLIEILSSDAHPHIAHLRTVPELRRVFLRLAGHPILAEESLDLAAIIGELYEGNNHEKPSLREITKQVAKHFRLKVPDLTGTSRRQGIVHARGVAVYLCRKIRGSSYEELGRHFGGRDHTTILHAFQRAARQVETDLEICHTVTGLSERLLAAAAGGLSAKG